MPVTKTAKRALRVSRRKTAVNETFGMRFETAVRKAKRVKTESTIKEAMSLADRASKNKIIHKNKAARIKSSLAKLLKPARKKAPAKKKTSKAKKAK